MSGTLKGLSFDFSTCLGRGRITKANWQRGLKNGLSALERLSLQVESGELGFWKLPLLYGDKKLIAPIEKAAKLAKSRFDNLVVIGIGGSALGSRMLLNSLAHRYHNELERKGKEAPLHLYLLENNDPDSFNDLMNHLDLSRTLFNVISKSGSTIETACQFSLVQDVLKKKFPKDWRKRLLFTTDPESGKLREMADSEGIETLEVPSDVGGRYSVLSPVGLFPALCMGANVRELLSGAADMAQRCLIADPLLNPALAGAVVHWLADEKLNKNMVVAMPYADKLRDWCEWYCQLWAESLGKAQTSDGRKTTTGTTPIKALGAIDQHSQVQLYMEGPNDKLFMFVRVGSFKKATRFPAKRNLSEAFQYLAGHNMAELIQAEQRATRFALGKQGRMSYQVDMPKVDARGIGQLIFWCEAMTAIAGYMYNINPFDQPGVELGKCFAYGLMGRQGFEKYRRIIEDE